MTHSIGKLRAAAGRAVSCFPIDLTAVSHVRELAAVRAHMARELGVHVEMRTPEQLAKELVTCVEALAVKAILRTVEEVQDAMRFYAASPELGEALRMMSEPVSLEKWGKRVDVPRYVPRLDAEGKLIPYPEVMAHVQP